MKININLFHIQSGPALPAAPIVRAKPAYRNYLAGLIFFLSFFKGLLAFVLELGNDESYYWLYSQYLQWNYFDHPPMVAVWIRLFTLNGALDHLEGFVRLGSIAGSALSTYFLFRAVASIHNEKSGWYAAVLYNASFYAGITAGLYILPDSPQMVFWTFSLWMIALLVNNENNWRYWILLGIAAGLCMMSKVHGAFIWTGLGLWILFYKRLWLLKPQFYVAAAITVLLVSPIYLWNRYYDFVTWRFHSRRVDIDGFGLDWTSFGEQFLSQVGFNNPVNVTLILAAGIAWLRGRWKGGNVLRIYSLIGLPLALSLLIVSLFRDTTLPHWSGPAYVTLIPLAAIRLSQIKKGLTPAVLKWSLGLFLFVYTAWAAAVQYYPGTYSCNTHNLGAGDITVDMYGWRFAAEQFSALYKSDVAAGLMSANAAMVTTYWWGAHVEYYFGRPNGIPMYGLNDKGLGHYLWTNAIRLNKADLNYAYCIVPSTDQYRIPGAWYKNAELARVIEISRSGIPAHRFYVYRLKGYSGTLPMMK